jgi:hypothetical protein
VYDLLNLVKPETIEIPEFADVLELKRFTYAGIDVGMATASSIISQTRDHRFDTRLYRDRIRNHILTSINNALNARLYYQRLRPDRVYVFNGRFHDVRPFLRVGQQLGVEVYTHERGANYKRWNLTPNTLPHDSRFVQTEMRRLWAEAPIGERERIGGQWFEDRARGVMHSTPVFTSGQDPALLPEGFDTGYHNITIFNSSQDEYEAIFQTNSLRLFDDQNHAIAQIAQLLASESRVRLYLRVHPNLKHLDVTQVREIKALNYPNLTIIPPESPISSYRLLKESNTAFVMGSSMGPEATYWGKPAVLLGTSNYSELGCTYTPETVDELVNLLRDPELTPLPRETSLVYGYYMNTFGYPFTLFEPTALFEGRFQGRSIRVRPWFWPHVSLSLRYRLGKTPLRGLLKTKLYTTLDDVLVRRALHSTRGRSPLPQA